MSLAIGNRNLSSFFHLCQRHKVKKLLSKKEHSSASAASTSLEPAYEK